MKRLLLLVVSIPFLFVGLLLASLDFNNLILEAKTTANDTRLQVQRTKIRANEINDYIREFGELPSNKLLACDWQPCPEHFFWLWDLVQLKDGQYKLSYLKMSNRFGPFFYNTVVYDSVSQTTNHDWLQNKRNLYFHAIFKLAVDLLIMFFPIVSYLFYSRVKHT